MEQSGHAPAVPRPRLLVMEADAVVRALVGEAVRSIGDVVEAESPGRALSILSAVPDDRFDVVLVSCMYSGRAPHYVAATGFVHEVFRRWPSVPVIALCDTDNPERVAADVLLSGVRDVVRMPLGGGPVADAVQRVLREHPVGRPASAGNVAAIRRVLDFLDTHVTDVPALTELAVMAAMSRSHFSRTFHAVVGMPLRDYVRDLRLKRAHALLLTAKLSLTNIAVESGFYDLPHFDKAFRHRLGMSPNQFRTRYANPPPYTA
jgi:AraC-like DNA-binding protein/CheY-like chemotaxis protein